MNASVVLGGLLLLILWGAYGITAKFAIHEIGLQILVWSPLVSVILLPIYFILFKELSPIKLDNVPGLLWAIVTALLGISGTVVLYWLLRDAPASIVIPISALYPVVTALLAFFILHEELTLVRIAGIGLAVVAIWLLSS